MINCMYSKKKSYDAIRRQHAQVHDAHRALVLRISRAAADVHPQADMRDRARRPQLPQPGEEATARPEPGQEGGVKLLAPVPKPGRVGRGILRAVVPDPVRLAEGEYVIK